MATGKASSKSKAQETAAARAAGAVGATVRQPAYPKLAPEVEALVHEVIDQVAAKWTMLVLEVLEQSDTLRFTQIAKAVPGISQKMLTQTLRQMERDGLVSRKVHPVIPPHVDYTLTELGHSLSAAFCGVWTWAEAHYAQVRQARERFEAAGALKK